MTEPTGLPSAGSVEPRTSTAGMQPTAEGFTDAQRRDAVAVAWAACWELSGTPTRRSIEVAVDALLAAGYRKVDPMPARLSVSELGGNEPIYDAVFQMIAGSPYDVSVNAFVWRCVHAAIKAFPAAGYRRVTETPETVRLVATAIEDAYEQYMPADFGVMRSESDNVARAALSALRGDTNG